MHKSLLFSVLLGIPSIAMSDECENIGEINSLYVEATSSKNVFSTKRLQQQLGVTADGIWGRKSEAAYTRFVNRCNSYSYPITSSAIRAAEITDYYSTKTTFEQTPIQVCSTTQEPMYGQLPKTTNNTGAVVGGALVGGIIGKIATDSDTGAVAGALIGGAIANENQKTQTETRIIGYQEKQTCQTEYKRVPSTVRQYDYSTITFSLDGVKRTIQFQK